MPHSGIHGNLDQRCNVWISDDVGIARESGMMIIPFESTGEIIENSRRDGVASHPRKAGGMGKPGKYRLCMKDLGIETKGS